MIDVPVTLVLVGSAIQAAAPVTRIVSGLCRRDRRIEEADADLARDRLMIGIAGINEIYLRG